MNHEELIEALRQKVAEARALIEASRKQEPAAWLVDFENGEQELHFHDLNNSLGETQTALYAAPVVADDVMKDAERYRWLLDNCSYSYAMQPDSPAEHGIEYQWQQGTYEERNHGINKTIDAAIADMKDAA
jgi:hypothetical protein